MSPNPAKARPTREQMLKSPAEHAPPGVVADFVHPWSMKSSAEAALIALYILTTIIVWTRFYAQRRVAGKLVREDYVVALTWIIYTAAFMPVGVLLARAPMGVHQWNITLGQFARYLYLQYVEFIIWGIVIMLLKVAILLQYLRVFVGDGIRGFMFWASHVILWANVAYYIAFTFIFMFVCNPRALFWDKTITHGKCLDIFGINVISAVICVVSDLLILILPQRTIYKLHLPLRKRVGLSILFAIGFFACATSAVRLYYNIHLWKHQSDVTFQLGYISFWGTAQIPAGFFIVCLPSLPKAVNHFRGKPWFLHFEASLRSVLHLSPPKSQPDSAPRVVTIGGGGQENLKRTVISDVEFRELILTTKDSVSSQENSTEVATD
ncbi:Nn.00g112060.m01.CDS01 [Neocucurbitaria sp. VM-36]